MLQTTLKLLYRDVLHLIYPEICLICSEELTQQDCEICALCESDLKFTYFEKFDEPSSLDKLFWGRIQLNATFALLAFQKENSTQQILHNIKYKNKQELAVEMGRRMGQKIALNPAKYAQIEALVPVPIHPKKRYFRGYNQSELIAQGIAEVLKIPVLNDFLTKNTHTESQTKKGKFLRWDNVESVFQLKNEANYQHIAIVDDVVTTGSTLEASMQKIHASIPTIQITVLSLAFAIK